MAKKFRRKSHRRDPASESRDWPKQPIRHARASHKGWKRKMGKGWRPKTRSRYAGSFRRDPEPGRDPMSRDWPKQPIRHARASHKGWKHKMGKGWRPKSHSRYAGWFRRDPGRDWPGDPLGHARAGKLGWRATAKSGWRPKRPSSLSRLSKREIGRLSKREIGGLSKRGADKKRYAKKAARKKFGPKIFHAKMRAPKVRVTRVTSIAIAPRRPRRFKGFKTAKGKEIAARLRGEGWVRSSKTGRWSKKHGFFRGQRLSAGQTRAFAIPAQAPRHPDSWMRERSGARTAKGREIAARLGASGWVYNPKSKRWFKRSAGVGLARDWPGHGKEHARIARKAWRRHAKKSWRPKHPELRKFRGRDPEAFGDPEGDYGGGRMARRHKRHALRSRFRRASHYGRGY